MSKCLIVCCDGTWQNLYSPFSTNVVKIAQMIKPKGADGTSQVIYYQAGLGSGYDDFDKIAGGAFGWGIDNNIQDAYRFLCLNYENNDQIYLFGFSRGAYTVRSLAGMIYCSGLLKRQHIRQIPQAYNLYRVHHIRPNDPDAIAFRNKYGEHVPIKLLACWDTVGELGVPKQTPFISDWINHKYKFHDTQVNRLIENALHAVAIDERREIFNVTPMRISDGADTKLRQVWFPGNHSCIGGGQETSGLSDITLKWMVDETKNLDNSQLEFIDDIQTVVEKGIHANFQEAFNNQLQWFEGLTGIIERDIVNPDHDLKDYTVFDQDFFNNNIHSSTKMRWKLKQFPPYRPKNLIKFHQFFDAFVD
ncbi:DUF2235 domain-containing protein [Dendronalium sp. ChiSLP03b]|uniref:DUF2235 domain-containing protein n=1 Tax=Dendronalium sp. ChiSLP03b TaxID=3075381 RepID=UPI002AD4C4CA|nr:DUF2235 domain-containing protein [Dendronalium sp. ChiSLP03b]MDZ8209124.1 DUF2235 domain-containing protein [Dendronalium sp. ChiSLP03b]